MRTVGRPDRDGLAAEPVVQVVGQGLGGRVAVRGVLVQGLEDDRLQVAVQRRVELARGEVGSDSRTDCFVGNGRWSVSNS